jgi:hypothetical protein
VCENGGKLPAVAAAAAESFHVLASGHNIWRSDTPTGHNDMGVQLLQCCMKTPALPDDLSRPTHNAASLVCISTRLLPQDLTICMNSSRSISSPFRIDNKSGCAAGCCCCCCWPGAEAAAATTEPLVLHGLLLLQAWTVCNKYLNISCEHHVLLQSYHLAAGAAHRLLLLLTLQLLLLAVALLLLLPLRRC